MAETRYLSVTKVPAVRNLLDLGGSVPVEAQGTGLGTSLLRRKVGTSDFEAVRGSSVVTVTPGELEDIKFHTGYLRSVKLQVGVRRQQLLAQRPPSIQELLMMQGVNEIFSDS